MTRHDDRSDWSFQTTARRPQHPAPSWALFWFRIAIIVAFGVSLFTLVAS